MSFPQALAERIQAITEHLTSFGAVTTFRYRIADLDPAEATRPDLDDSAWQTYEGSPPPFRRDQGVTWVRVRYTVPDACMDIPLAGSQLRVTAGGGNGQPFFSPIRIYADGTLLLAEDAWMDCKCPEGIITEDAKPGDTHTIALRVDYGEKSFWEPNLPLYITSDAVERYALHLSSIVEELRFAEGFGSAKTILPDCYALLEAATDGSGAKKLMEAAAQCRSLCEPLREEIKKHKVYVVTHAHIDMNWFWPMEETEQIIDRDFSTMTKLMEENPDFRFSQSQCATYAIEERNNPEVFAKMQRFAREGQWDVTASTWVEGDLNMASGESIARHVLYSKRYLAEKFDANPRIMWCPDTFGHPANTPQILKQTGVDYYFHTRCGIGVMESHYGDFDFVRDAHQAPVYWWKGQDGSRVLVVNTTYGREFSTRGVLLLSEAMRERFGYDKAMFVFGVGDHGGGPTLRDIGWMREINQFPTVPTLQFSTTHEFYDQVVADNPAGIPERSGEMNFVFDGCYTTHADIKYYNRRCENDLEATENLCVMASLTGFAYPAGELEELWRVVLFNQFHDILDGSGVKDTYRFSAQEGEKVLARLREISADALAHIAAQGPGGDGQRVIAYNPTYARRDESILIPVEGDYVAVDAEGRQLPCQRVEGGVLLAANDLPPMSYKVFSLKEQAAAAYTPIVEKGDHYLVDTDRYEIEIHKGSGRITTLFDKCADRYVVCKETIGWRLKNGCLNTLQVHYEEPTGMSSWTIGTVREIRSLIDGAVSEIVEDGPIRKRIRFTHKVGHSTITQDIVIGQSDARIDFVTHVDWNEYGDFNRDAPMLKVAFSPNVRNTAATYEIPYGVIERFAGDYECPGLRWADISDGGYGFSVLNNCKHGYKSRGNAMELTLIRSGWLPDQKSDIGSHDFTYAILPHEGCWKTGETMQQAAFLNNPVRTAMVDVAGKAAPCASLVAVDDPDVPMCGIKRCEDSGDIVVKLYNTADNPVKTTARTGFAIAEVAVCNLLEQPVAGYVRHDCGSFEVALAPREIKSYRIRLG